MKKIPLLITVGIVALCVGGYFAYEKFLTEHYLSPWELVPENTVAVYEASECIECATPVKNSPVWEVIRRAAFYGAEQDSLLGILNFLNTPKAGLLASLHITKKDDFDFIFYVPLPSGKERRSMDDHLDEWKKNKRYRSKEHEYNTVKIQEISSASQIFSWVVLDNVWVGSFTPFLVEDIVRVYSEKPAVTFKSNIVEVYQLPRIKKDGGNLYVHLSNFSDWLSLFVPGMESESLQHFGKASLLDIAATAENLVLNGFSLTDISKPSVLSIFTDQTPTPFSLKQYVSNRTVLMTSYGISQGEKFGEKLKVYPKRKAFQDTLTQLSASMKLNFEDLYKTIGNEVGVCYVESGNKKFSKIAMIECVQPNEWMAVLTGLSDKLSIDTVFFEHYSDFDIREVPMYKFPEKIFWPFITGFEHCYFTLIDRTIVLGEDLEELKLFIEDIDHEDTWGKSVAQNKFLESTLLESNISLYINTSLVWNVLTQSLNQKWEQFIRDNQNLLEATGMGAIQFSHLNESFYTNISWSFHKAEIAKAKRETSNVVITSFDHGILSRPYVFRSHLDRTDEVLLQDSTYQLHLISAKGKVLWSLSLNGPITGEVSQIDYYANGKLQYFFATPGMLHIVDRLGEYVNPFPVIISAKEIEYSTVVDYDHSKKYRFLISEKSGKMWMYDKVGMNLEGWKPAAAGGALFTGPQHHRIRGKDYIIAIRKDGKVSLMSRRGEMLKGFPLDLNARPAGDYFIEIGNTIANTNFVIISRDGFLIKFNIEGKIQTRETLVKNAIETQFSLAGEKTGKSYVVVRQDNKQLSLLDEHGKDFITNEFIGLNPVVVNYYDFGAGKIFYSLTDITQGLSFVYDSQGKLISYPPIESFLVTLKSPGDEKLIVYFTQQKSLTVKPLF